MKNQNSVIDDIITSREIHPIQILYARTLLFVNEVTQHVGADPRGSEMDHDLYDGQKNISKVLRNRKRAVDEEVQINSISPENWKSCKELLFRQEENKESTIENIDLEETSNGENITQQEVHKVIKELKIRKTMEPVGKKVSQHLCLRKETK